MKIKRQHLVLSALITHLPGGACTVTLPPLLLPGLAKELHPDTEAPAELTYGTQSS